MDGRCVAAAAAVSVGAVLGMAATAVAAPTAAGGAPVRVVGAGVPTPTAFAFVKGTTFVAGYGSEDGKTAGGVFVLRGGAAVKLRGLPGAAGIAWHRDELYVSAVGKGGVADRIVAYGGWNGKRFATRRVVFTGPAGFTGFNGLAFGPEGRIYAGVSLAFADDHRASTKPYAQSVVSMTTSGADITQMAVGLRQPWQLAFAPGDPSPFVTVLGQENLGRTRPPDYIVHAAPGDDYGFPVCNWSAPKACATYARPLALLPAHSSPTGIAARGDRLYVALFVGRARGPEVVRLPVAGGPLRTVVSGFPAPVSAVAVRGAYLFAGDATGQIYRTRA